MNFKIHKIVGDSMSPTIQPNDYVLSWSWFRTNYRVGDIVLIKHPQYKLIIKRIFKIHENGDILLVGDNSASINSEEMGWQNPNLIIGKAIYHISQRRPTTPHRALSSDKDVFHNNELVQSLSDESLQHEESHAYLLAHHLDKKS